jgi:hypothetical protein
LQSASKRSQSLLVCGIIAGGSQYDRADHQRIEELSPQQIVRELREEIADAVNYLTGLDVYLARIPWQVLQ